jgi:hypothetical protein
MPEQYNTSLAQTFIQSHAYVPDVIFFLPGGPETEKNKWTKKTRIICRFWAINEGHFYRQKRTKMG